MVSEIFRESSKKLDYIKELGCNAIWLNPCFVSPFSDAGYDVADYYTAAPRYGTNEDLKELFAKAHEKGMHVILDLVPGHTSIEHPWFKASLSPEENEFTHRYIWTDKSLERDLRTLEISADVSGDFLTETAPVRLTIILPSRL